MSRRSEFFRQIDKDIAQAKRASEMPEFNAALVERAQKRMMRVDDLPRDIRELVYDYGLEIVQEFINHRITKAASIRHLIDTVRDTPLPNGLPRFKVNKGPNAKQNPAKEEDEYYAITANGRNNG